MLAPILSLAIVAFYVWSVWRLLRHESREFHLVLLVIVILALALRLAYLGDYPPGLNEDEVKGLERGQVALNEGTLFGRGVEGPILLNALFMSQLLPLLGPVRWAVRGYSFVGGILACAVIAAVGRAMRLGRVASLVGAALVAVLPVFNFYSRVAWGGELTFHQALLLAALARLIWQNGNRGDVVVGGVASGLLLWDYAAGRSMLAMPILAAALASGMNSLRCLLIPLGGLLVWSPYLAGFWLWVRDQFGATLDPGYHDSTLTTVARKFVGALDALTRPRSRTGWMSIPSGATFPWLALGLAPLGFVRSWRHAVFLLGGFCLGLTPSLLSEGTAPSAHRMLMAYTFIPLAIACGIDAVPRPRLRCWAAVSCVAVLGVLSVRSFFSATYWDNESQAVFPRDRTLLAETAERNPAVRKIVDGGIKYHWGLRRLSAKDSELLSVENWLPPTGVPLQYVMGPHSSALRAFYLDLFGSERMTMIGQGFLLRLEAADWRWIEAHGWTYRATCEATVRQIHVPTLHQRGIGFRDLACPHGADHEWRARWNGPREWVAVTFSGDLGVEVNERLVAEKHGEEQEQTFELVPGDDVRLHLHTEGLWPDVKLFEMSPQTRRLPRWESATPIDP